MKTYQKLKVFIFIHVCFLICMQYSYAQRIRKNHLEMTPGEKTAYVQAINQMFNNGTIQNMANHHSGHFNTEIHTRSNPLNGTQFLPWHRVFQLEFEQKLRAAGTSEAEYLTVPYWDWRVENTVSDITWDDNDFLAPSSNWGVFRSIGGGTLASTNDVNMLLSLTGDVLPSGYQQQSTTSSFFSKHLEAWHDYGHVFVGGTMNSTESPRDPVFFLHHGFADKLWQDWEDRDNSVQSSFNYASLIHYNLINPNSIIDSRYTQYQDDNNNIFRQDVWYAYNKKLILDGLNGDFNVTGINKLYCYTAWNGSNVEGTIYAGDLRRDESDNVIPDNKGGFVIKSGSQCDFRAGSEILLMPGFSAESGATFTASIVNAPCGFTDNLIASQVSNSKNELMFFDKTPVIANSSLRAFPNPFDNKVVIQFSLNSSAKVKLHIVNSVGQMVATPLRDQLLGSGLQTIEWKPGTNISTGIYYCIVYKGLSKETIKLYYSK